MDFIEFDYTTKSGQETMALRKTDILSLFKYDEEHTTLSIRGKKGKRYHLIVDEPFASVLERMNSYHGAFKRKMHGESEEEGNALKLKDLRHS